MAEPSVGDVHQTTSLKGKKAKSFLSSLADAQARQKAEKRDDAPTVEGGDDFELSITVTKADNEQRMIFGWAFVAAVDGKEIVDKQDHMIAVAELEQAAYDFVLHYREQGHMHEKKDVGRIVESMMFTPEKEAIGLVAKNDKGEKLHGWFVGFKVLDDEVWKAVKAGELPEFSIGGRAVIN